MSLEGFLYLHRKLAEWEWYDDANTMRLFIHCLIFANFKEKQWRGITIKRGQFITSQPKLAQGLKLSVRQIRTSLDKLKMTGELTVYTTVDYSIITINNYDIYQPNDRLTNSLMTDKRQANDRLMTTTNNDNNDNNENNEKNINRYIKEEEEEQKKTKIDYLTDPIINQVYEIYKQNCKDLIPLDKFCNMNVELKKLIGSYLEQTESDLNYFTDVCKKANKIKKIGSVNVDLKVVLKNHDGFYNGKYETEEKNAKQMQNKKQEEIDYSDYSNYPFI